TESVQLLAAGEVNLVDLVDDVPQQVARVHPIDGALEDGGDHVAPVTLSRTLERTEVGKQPRTAGAAGTGSVVVVDEGDQVVAGDAVVVCGPVAPAVGRLDGGTVGLTAQRGLGLADALGVVQELEEHDPGEHGQTVEVAVEPAVL